MKLKAPEFWYHTDKSELKSLPLLPFGALFGIASTMRQTLKHSVKAGIPVLCIGNLTVGGSGKTPAAIMFLGLIKDLGIAENPAFLTRGYGRKKDRSGSLLVNPAQHSALDCGDEALLLAKHAPVIVDSDRARGAAYAKENGADFIIMDDGLQNPGLHKDLSLIVIDGSTGFGNKKVIPAGPLREPLFQGLKKADLFMIVGEDKTGAANLLPESSTLIWSNLGPRNNNPSYGVKYIAFAGIAHPDKFFDTLNKLGIKTIKRLKYPDHHSFSKQEIEKLYMMAAEQDARLITTEKDLMRIKGLSLPYLPEYLPVEMKLDQTSEQRAAQLLTDKFKKHQ